MPQMRETHECKIAQILLQQGYSQNGFNEVESSDALADPVLFSKVENQI